MWSFLTLAFGYVFGILVDFFVINKSTPNIDLTDTMYVYWSRRKLYLVSGLICFVAICMFYFAGEVQLPKDFKLDLKLFVIQGLRTSEFIVGFVSSYLLLVLAKFTSTFDLEPKAIQTELKK